MANLDTQTLVALVCVAVALAVLCRRTISWWKGQSTGGCGGGCHGCGGSEPPAQLKVPLTVIDLESSTATVIKQPAPSQEAAP